MLYDVIKTARSVTDSVIVAFSCGKDSVVTLDLARSYFPNLFVFFMYFVKGLEFQEAVLRWYEKKYDIPIYRIPHFELSGMLKHGLFRIPDDNVPIIDINDIYAHVRRVSGFEWILAGETIADSIWRRAMIKHSGTIDFQRRRIYPVAYFRKKHIKTYIRRNRLKLAPESKILKDRSFGRLAPWTIFQIKQHFPADYERIRSWFPFVEASVKKYEIYKTKTGGYSK